MKHTIARDANSEPTILQRLGLLVGPTLVTALLRTTRIFVSPIPSGGAPSVVAFWHGGMLVPWYLHRHRRAAALVSASRDGDILAAILERWGIAVVRGSSSAGGSDAVHAMVELVERGFTVLITPDGPRGPRYEMKIGAFVVAQRAGAPVVLCAPRYHSAWRLKSWDAFAVPKPWSRVDVEWRDPVSVPADCVGQCLEEMRARCERDLREMHANA